MARANITDRAHRYRANKLAPAGRKVCAWCGSTSNVVPDHIDGHPDHTTRDNLQWLCKSCNTKKGAAFAKLGKGRLTKQYNPSQGVPTFQQYAWAVANHTRGAHDEGGVIIHATPRRKRIEYAKQIAGVKRERGTDSSLPEWARNPGKRNPAEAAAEAFKEFHGYPPNEVIKVVREVHHHKHLAAAGDLAGLIVRPIDARLPNQKIEGMGDALLCFNEKKNQLFIENANGISNAGLRRFGITTVHEIETIGKILKVGYFTDKKHLGKEGGEAIYSHTFRTTNENGTHITVKIARYPDLIYRVLEEQFEISGGSYEILREGIDK